MATSSLPITLNFFANKSKFCLQALNKESSTNRKTVRLNADSDLKIKLEAHEMPHNHNGRSSTLKSFTETLKVDQDMMTSSPAIMEQSLLGGRMIKGGAVFQQNIYIRSFEIDHHHKLLTKALMNYLQEASVRRMGLAYGAVWGVTPEMSKRDLAWVFRCMHIEVDSYPSWSDVVQLHHWMYTSGRASMRIDWIINDIATTQTLVRASGLAVIMSTKTRKTCKLPEEVKEELNTFLTINAEPILEAHTYPSPPPQLHTMDHIRTGLIRRWHDLDFNYHVNNSTYLDWILESTPSSLICSHELCTINLEYQKECLKDDVLRSLSKVVSNSKSNGGRRIELQHVVCLESGPQVLRARTTWRPQSLRLPTQPNPSYD